MGHIGGYAYSPSLPLCTVRIPLLPIYFMQDPSKPTALKSLLGWLQATGYNHTGSGGSKPLYHAGAGSWLSHILAYIFAPLRASFVCHL
jgi:hypothetical protein